MMQEPKPQPVDYDEALVEVLEYIPDTHDNDGYRWSGGFFREGRRNASPHRGAGNPDDPRGN